MCMITLHLRRNDKYVYKQTKICYLTLHHGRRHFELFCCEINTHKNILLYAFATMCQNMQQTNDMFIYDFRLMYMVFT